MAKNEKEEEAYKSKLYFIRRELMLSLVDMERLTGVSHSTINRIENNEVRPQYATARKIARALGMKTDDIFEDYD